MDYIGIYYSLEKNIMTKEKEQLIQYGRKTVIGLSKVVVEPDNRIMYYLQDGPERVFVREELMLIPENTELPPDFVQKW